MRTISILSVTLIFMTNSCAHNSTRQKNNTDNLKDTFTIYGSSQNSRQESIKIANQIFKISDSSAIRILKSVDEIQTILDNKYKDTTIMNDFLVGDYPTYQNPFWEIVLCQFQPKLEKMHPILFLFVDANSGQVTVIDNGINDDRRYTIEEWKKLKRK